MKAPLRDWLITCDSTVIMISTMREALDSSWRVTPSLVRRSTAIAIVCYCDIVSGAICSAIALNELRSSTPSSALKNLSGPEAHCCNVW